MHLARASRHGVSLSAGSAAFRKGVTAAELVAEADRSMYNRRAEQRGLPHVRPASLE
jgi:hypothetical protein